MVPPCTEDLTHITVNIEVHHGANEDTGVTNNDVEMADNMTSQVGGPQIHLIPPGPTLPTICEGVEGDDNSNVAAGGCLMGQNNNVASDGTQTTPTIKDRGVIGDVRTMTTTSTMLGGVNTMGLTMQPILPLANVNIPQGLEARSRVGAPTPSAVLHDRLVNQGGTMGTINVVKKAFELPKLLNILAASWAPTLSNMTCCVTRC